MNDTPEALRLTAAELEAAGALCTAREIAQQPHLWLEIARLLGANTALEAFMAPLRADRRLRLLLTGAGTSSFIGECLAPALTRQGWARAEAVATTDIVASPGSFLRPDVGTLMVHFARSGNSPESVAALELSQRLIEHCNQLIVTCNADGALYRHGCAMRHACAVLLPAASNDQSFAMTSSFTGMLLAAGAALQALPANAGGVARLARAGTYVVDSCGPVLGSLVQSGFERVVYLGNNALKGLAREAALKMLELTDGRVIALADSPLGFRHGPKTILNGGTLVAMFLSNDAHARRYELDLLRELRRDGVAGRIIALSGREHGTEARDAVLAEAADLSDLELCFPYAVFAQSLALLRSLSLGLTPDTPNVAGTVSRVVRGVSIYPYDGNQ